MNTNNINKRNILTPIFSFILGIVGLIILFYPLLLLRFPIEIFLESHTKYHSLISIFVVNSLIFLIIGILVNKLFQKKFLNINVYLTIPFTFPIVFGLYFMYFFGASGNETFLELFPGYVGAFLPLIAYIIGLFISRRNKH